ncbi:MAG: tRNA 2-selenouridine(34) synthase MnmH [Gammaproteobacteria bacterium]
MPADCFDNFDDIIDARSPAEYAADCIPGAVNIPALDNEQRRAIGILHKSDPFAARLRGATMLAENIAVYLRAGFAEKPQHWRPLVYCQRGGQRSGAVVEVLRRIGWQAAQLDGGYKTYRRIVINGIAECAAAARWIVVIGKTGVGKTELLSELAKQGEAVLDLEKLANHRGSVFGGMGGQPSQRRFESLLYLAMKQLPNNHAVFVESEGRKIGGLHLPAPMLSAMRASADAVLLSASVASRAERIHRQYAGYAASEELFAEAVGKIATYAGKTRVQKWRKMHNENDISQLLADMLQNFYDIGYDKSLRANYSAAKIISRFDTGEMTAEKAAKAIIGRFVHQQEADAPAARATTPEKSAPAKHQAKCH